MKSKKNYQKTAAFDLNEKGVTRRLTTFWQNLAWGAGHQILGAHILSDHASGMLNTIKQAMLNKTTVDELYRQTIVSPYPTRESDLSYMLEPLLTD